jgi:O-antigen/teichoic acid export membrane protein
MNRAAGLFIARGWAALCQIVSLFAIGHELDPVAFGFYAIASSAVLLPQMLVGAGFAEHVISRDRDRRDEHLAFWCTAAIGFAGAALAVVAGLSLSAFGVPEPMPLLLIYLAPLPALCGLAAISEAALVRDNRGGALASTLFASETIGLAVMLFMLWQGAGVYALAYARLANLIVTLVGYGAVSRVRITGAWEWSRVRELWRFAAGIISGKLVFWADGFGIDLLLAAVMNPAGVGLYRMGSRVVGAPSSVFVQSVGQAQLAYLGERLAAAPRRLGAAMIRATRLHYSLVTPLFVLLAVCADDLVAIVLDPQWSASAPVLAILALGVAPTISYTIGASALVAVGQSGRLAAFQIAALACTIVAMLVGAALYGPIGAAMGKTAGSIISAAIVIGAVRELAAHDRRRVFGAVGSIALASAACGVAALSVDALIPATGDIAWGLARIGVIGVAGLCAYALALPLLAPNAFRQLRFLVRRRLAARRERAVSAPTVEPVA